MVKKTIGQLRQEGIAFLTKRTDEGKSSIPSGVVSTTPVLDVDCILSFVANVSRSYVLSHPEYELSNLQCEFFLKSIKQRKKGFPVAYIIGKKEFYGRNFFVTPDVLIPKADTELLVEHSLLLAKEILLTKNSLRVADVCTGSGCIAISFAKELEKQIALTNVEIVATDISEKALSISKKNAKNLNCSIRFFQGDLLEPLIEKGYKFNLLLTNPPYVPALVAKELLKDGRSEPFLALNGDCEGTIDGTGVISRMISQFSCVLEKNSYVLIEAGEYNISKVATLLSEYGFVEVRIFSDLAQMPRVVQAKWCN